MIIEPLTIDNYKEVAKIDNICLSDESWSENQFLEEINDNTKFYSIIKESNKYIGFCSFVKVLDEAQILNVAVLPEFRNKGYGSILLDSIIENCSKLNINSISLEVRYNNEYAIKLYENKGFKKVGIRKGFYKNNIDALIYVKHI